MGQDTVVSARMRKVLVPMYKGDTSNFYYTLASVEISNGTEQEVKIVPEPAEASVAWLTK